MCKFCEEDKRKKRDCIINTPIVSLRIIKNNGLNALEVKSYNREKQIVDNYKIINYCPMCRKEAGRVNKLTVKMIKEAIKDLPDETECELWSDTGLDQCVYEEDVVPVLEECFVEENKLIIYGNWRNIDEEDKQ